MFEIFRVLRRQCGRLAFAVTVCLNLPQGGVVTPRLSPRVRRYAGSCADSYVAIDHGYASQRPQNFSELADTQLLFDPFPPPTFEARVRLFSS